MADETCEKGSDQVLRERLENLLWAHDNPDDITSLPANQSKGLSNLDCKWTILSAKSATDH
jgi:hypothetical protein